MKEIEVKVIEINKEEMVSKLLELGAEKIFEGALVSISYDDEDENLAKKGAFIRVRKVGEKTYELV